MEKILKQDYSFHYSYLLKVMKQYIREYDGQMAYFDGQSTFDLLDGTLFINLDISQLEERFARPLAQQILLAWIWEKYVKKNSLMVSGWTAIWYSFVISRSRIRELSNTLRRREHAFRKPSDILMSSTVLRSETWH